MTPAEQQAEQAVREVESAYDAAWARGDLSAVLDCVHDDVVVVSPRGDVAQGRREFQSLLERFMHEEGDATTHESSVHRIVFVTDEVAVVDAEALIARPETADQTAFTLRHGFTDVVVRRDGVWRISQIRAYPQAGGPPHHTST